MRYGTISDKAILFRTLFGFVVGGVTKLYFMMCKKQEGKCDMVENNVSATLLLYEKLRCLEGIKDKLEHIASSDMISINFHEYMLIEIIAYGADSPNCKGVFILNKGLYYYHPTSTEEEVELAIKLARGDDIFIENHHWLWRFFQRFSIISKKEFEKNRQMYLPYKHLRIYSGSGIIKREGSVPI